MKQQLVLQFSDDELYGDQREYLFPASPNRNLTAKVMEVKENFYSAYKHKLAIDTWPHITLANFKAKKSLETSLVDLIKKACSKHRKFIVGLRDYNGFDPSTIYINVQDHQPFLKLADSLGIINDLLWCNKYSAAYLVNNPHLTIARRIPYWIYTKAIEEYRKRSFQDVFVVDELILCRRRHQNDKCQRVTTLSLSSN